MEYGDFGMPGATAITHSVSLKRRAKLNLIDIGAALNSLAPQIPDLKAMVGNASMNGKWVDIKYPMPCQILGHWPAIRRLAELDRRAACRTSPRKARPSSEGPWLRLRNQSDLWISIGNPCWRYCEARIAERAISWRLGRLGQP